MNIILTLLTILCFLNLSSAAAAGKDKPNFHEEPTHSPNTQVALIFDIETLAELESIPKVIKTLNENHIKATFFISDRITLSPENLQIIQQVPKDRNHEIGLLFIVDSQKIHSNANSAYPLRKEIVEATFKFNANVYAIRIRFANEQTGIDLKYIEQNGRFVIPEIKAEIQSNTDGTISPSNLSITLIGL